MQATVSSICSANSSHEERPGGGEGETSGAGGKREQRGERASRSTEREPAGAQRQAARCPAGEGNGPLHIERRRSTAHREKIHLQQPTAAVGAQMTVRGTIRHTRTGQATSSW